MAAPQRKDAIFDYVMIEAGCLDNPGVRMKGVRISEAHCMQPVNMVTRRILWE